MKLRISCLLFAILVIFSLSTRAEYLDPEVKTQVNKQTNYFKDEAVDVNAMAQEFSGEASNAYQIINGGEAAVGEAVKDLSGGVSAGEVRNSADGLGSMKEDEISDRGRQKMMEEKIIEEIYPDEESALLQQDKKDLNDLADGSNKLLDNLLGQLKEKLDIDCKQIKGDKVIEPEYFVKIERIPAQDSTYDKKTCEEPRNRYSCSDRLALKCIKKQASELKHIAVPIDQIPDHWWTKNLSTLAQQYSFNSYPNYNHEVKNFISKRINNYNIEIPNQTIGLALVIAYYKISHKGSDTTFIFKADIDGMENEKIKVRLHYYLDSEGGCLEWQETWSEECRF